MKRSEFKRKVEELGFEVIEMKSDIDWDEYLVITNENEVVGSVNKNYEAVMDTNASTELNTEVRAKLLDILVEYARTPIPERKDEKKYSIYPIRTLNYKLLRYDGIFTCCGYEDEDSFDIAYSEPYEKGVSIAFTESEAKEICDFFGWNFDKVAVEVGDDE